MIVCDSEDLYLSPDLESNKQTLRKVALITVMDLEELFQRQIDSLDPEIQLNSPRTDSIFGKLPAYFFLLP